MKLIGFFFLLTMTLMKGLSKNVSGSAFTLPTSTMEPGIVSEPTTTGEEGSTLAQTSIPGFLLALTDNSTDNDNSSFSSLLMHVLGNQLMGVFNNLTSPEEANSSVDDLTGFIQDLSYVLQNTKPKDNTTTGSAVATKRASVIPMTITPTTAISSTVSFSGTTDANFSTNMYDLHSLTDVISILHTTKVSDMSLSHLNIITSRIETILHTQPFDVLNMSHVLTYLNYATQTNADTVQMLTSIVSKMIENDPTEEDEDIFGTMMPDLMLTMESVLSASHPSDVVSFTTPEIEVSSAVIQSNESIDGYVVMETIVGQVTVPVILVEDGQIRMTTIVYRNIQKRWTIQQSYSHAQIGSNVMCVSLQRLHNTTSEKLNISQPKLITMVLPTKVNGREKERLCTFWNFNKGIWDTAGGRLLTKNMSHTECQFDHLTNFAVLVLYYDQTPNMSKHQKQAMFILTVVSCSVSITCLGVCIILYLYLRLLSDEKILIHTNLCVALMLAQLVLVTSDGAEKVSAACKLVAVLLHFLFMASFSWMMLEGLSVYLACTRGLYNYGDMRLKFFLVGWGLPAVIVVVSVGVQFPNYGETTDDSCWLSVKDGLIWAFLGPMLVIVVFNLFILCLVIKVFLTLRANSRKTQAEKLRASVRAMVTLLPLLGVTWVLSILVPLHYVFHYLFTIGNSMQGIMIFLLHGIGNEEVRKGLSERRKRHSMTSTESITTINSSQPKIVRFKQLLVPVETVEKVSDRRQAWTEL